MASVCRVFYFDSVVSAPVNSGSGRYTTDSVATLKYPYLSRASVTADTVSAQSVTAAPSGAKLALVQVQNGTSVHIEVNPPNRAVAADTNSPIVRGDQMFAIGPDWSLSFLQTT